MIPPKVRWIKADSCFAPHPVRVGTEEIVSKLADIPENLRLDTGVIVAALTLSGGAQEIGLATGDVIRSVNGILIQNEEMLRSTLDKIKSGSPVALQIERDRQLLFVEFEI